MVQNRDDIKEIKRQLAGKLKDSHQKVRSDLTKHIMNIIKICVDDSLAMGYIHKAEHDYLLNQHPKIPLFYTLSTLHKKSVPG